MSRISPQPKISEKNVFKGSHTYGTNPEHHLQKPRIQDYIAGCKHPCHPSAASLHAWFCLCDKDVLWSPQKRVRSDWSLGSKEVRRQHAYPCFPILVKVGLYAVPKETHRCSIILMISRSLCMRQLSITITDFGAGKGFIWSSKLWMNCIKSSISKEPLWILQWIIPSRVSAGTMEYLWNNSWWALGTKDYIELIPFSPYKERMPNNTLSFQGPGILMESRSTITGAFINKDKLLRCKAPNSMGEGRSSASPRYAPLLLE